VLTKHAVIGIVIGPRFRGFISAKLGPVGIYIFSVKIGDDEKWLGAETLLQFGCDTFGQFARVVVPPGAELRYPNTASCGNSRYSLAPAVGRRYDDRQHSGIDAYQVTGGMPLDGSSRGRCKE
jgi:hypothetical protein